MLLHNIRPPFGNNSAQYQVAETIMVIVSLGDFTDYVVAIAHDFLQHIDTKSPSLRPTR